MGVRIDEVLGEGKYFQNDNEFSDNNNKEVNWSVAEQDEKVYTYDEAIDLTGNGWYNVSLLFTLTLAILAMVLDMFGFSIIVSASACDFNLDHHQASILLSMPLLGSILMAYPWGYISDTQGRKKSLVWALWGSFIIVSLSAFSPNWMVLAVLKLFATSLTSGVQSMAYTLLGESCGSRTKGRYMIILASPLMMGFASFYAPGYFILSMDFSYDLGFVVFKPWRLLALSLSLTLGCSAMLIAFFYESPKFLVNAGRTEEALIILRKIKKINHVTGVYPVKNILLSETSSFRHKDQSMMKSLWQQTVPLFKQPLLQRTLQLFYITAVVYSGNNGFALWFPIMVTSYFNNSTTLDKNGTEGFCNLVGIRPENGVIDDCSKIVSFETLMSSVIQGVVFLIFNLGCSLMAHRKKAVLITLSIFSSGCYIGMLFITEKTISLVVFYGILLNCISMGMIYSYFVELFPTSHRGMVSCLGTMVARLSGLAGVNLVGAFIFTHCSTSLYIWGAYIFSGALMSLLLPPDK